MLRRGLCDLRLAFVRTAVDSLEGLKLAKSKFHSKTNGPVRTAVDSLEGLKLCASISNDWADISVRTAVDSLEGLKPISVSVIQPAVLHLSERPLIP